MKEALHLGICLAALAAGSAAAAAEPKSAPAQTAVAAEIGGAGSATGGDKKYCIREAINSRIMRSFCKTAKEWENVGTAIEAKD